ncbi:uncharacterized protein DSM5745_04984 [Aspergillus mulundensis]|uniref:Uncharacterized protein n=1 Tax=Aspergillus mulundensis TaxID=1810919 RepID=A0A3D8S542_9EURO|nr:hypothetical protein DSM5745_04984 [Aspergillus mulundensis]RDW81427.1 hypothetical protein DSM5745_04984 [Aspergillus mulundensis]
MPGRITAYAVGITEDGRDNGDNHYRITASSEEALESWTAVNKSFLVKNVDNRWFVYKFKAFPNLFNSWMELPDKYTGEVIVEHLHNPLLCLKKPRA